MTNLSLAAAATFVLVLLTVSDVRAALYVLLCLAGFLLLPALTLCCACLGTAKGYPQSIGGLCGSLTALFLPLSIDRMPPSLNQCWTPNSLVQAIKKCLA